MLLIRVAFPDLLNTEADEGQLQHTKWASFLQNKPHGTEMVRGICPTIYHIAGNFDGGKFDIFDAFQSDRQN